MSTTEPELTIAEMAAETGLTTSTLRYYEQEGLLLQAPGPRPIQPPPLPELGHQLARLRHPVAFHRHALRSIDELDAQDFRRNNPRFQGENLTQNLAIVDAVEAVAAEADATPALVALAWILAQGEGIAPIPGTKRVSRLEENVAADELTLSADQVAVLNALPKPSGDRYADMSSVNR